MNQQLRITPFTQVHKKIWGMFNMLSKCVMQFMIYFLSVFQLCFTLNLFIILEKLHAFM